MKISIRNILLIIAFFMFNFSSYGQEILVKDPLAIKEKEEYLLEINQEGYTLYLAGLDNNGYFIKFKDKTELENFLEKALEIFKIPITYSSQKEAEIEWTHEYLKFCAPEGSSKGNKVEMDRGYLSPSKVVFRSYKFDSDKPFKTQPRGAYGFSQNEIIKMYNHVSGKDLPVVQEKGKTAHEAKKKNLDALMGGFSDGDGKANRGLNAIGYYGGGGFRLGNRKALNKPIPKYKCNEEGRVVVTISVDQSGRVITAHAGATGTTNSAPCLLNEAKKAAMNSKFNAGSKAPSKQVGEIIYNFSLSD